MKNDSMVMLSLVFLVSWVLFMGITYLVLAFLVWLFCIAFGFEFTWLLPLGIWASLAIFRMFAKTLKGK